MKDEKEFLREAKALLEDSSENLDPRTTQRIASVRLEALRGGRERPSPLFTPFRWILAGSFSMACGTNSWWQREQASQAMSMGERSLCSNTRAWSRASQMRSGSRSSGSSASCLRTHRAGSTGR